MFAVLICASSFASNPTTVEFNRDVRPILSNACFKCHGFDAKTRKADLRLDVPEGAFGKLEGGTPIVPGKPEASEVWKRIASTDVDYVMPPPDAHVKLSPADKAIIKRWIETGAKYQRHWSFEPIVRPVVPKVAKTGPSTAIDAFLDAKLATVGLRPNGRANRETLARRVSFALVGLPPSLEELDAYLNDKTPQAYERLVDRYLASRHFGEEMARHWLDVARYADTHGLHLDNERHMWLYRDWVVRSVNENLPFDRFTVWQVAGDLLPSPSADQLVATGFNRCNVTTGEGGALDAEFRYRYAVERASTVVQAWLGLTAGCAVCHDHKFDPLSMKEFYSLYAFFNDAADPPMDGNISNTPPFTKVQSERLRRATEGAAKVEREAKAWASSTASVFDYQDPATQTPPALRKQVEDVLFDDYFSVGSHSRSSTRNSTEWVLDPAFGVPSGRRAIRQASSASTNDKIEFRLKPIVVPKDARFAVWIRVDSAETPTALSVALANKPAVHWKRAGAGLAIEGLPNSRVEPDKWQRVELPIERFGLKQGEKIDGMSIAQQGGVAFWDRATIDGLTDVRNDPLESFAAWQAALGNNAAAELPADLKDLVASPPIVKKSKKANKISKAKKPAEPSDIAKLRHFYVTLIARPANAELQTARTAWESARTARIIAEEATPLTLVFRDQAEPRDSFVMIRGQYDKPGDKVQPATPAILPAMAVRKDAKRANRLDLANWLVDRRNPLTARVAVNRVWQQFFGTGLVKTSYDFGTQGDLPSHPELLDWLAVDFVDNGWNVKRLVKQIVMTDAFCRDSACDAERRARDPDNRLLARGPRLRLDAEQIRDAALYAAGLLDPKLGGRGVNVYQPPNIWEPVGYADSNTRYYLQDHGPALYRRSLYVFIKRTAPAPFLANFDAPNREQLCSIRERTNTPLQALQLMNDIQFFEAARNLAERVHADKSLTDADRLALLYRIVLARRPGSDETQILSNLLAKQRAAFAGDVGRTEKVLAFGESKSKRSAAPAELAAWTLVANAVLNLDEAVVRN